MVSYEGVANPLTAHLPNEVAPSTGDGVDAERRDRSGRIDLSMFVYSLDDMDDG